MKKQSRIGIVGTGYIAKGFVIANEDQDDVIISKALTRRDIKTCREFPKRDILTNSIDELIDNSDLVLECSGDIIHATSVVDQVMKAKRPVVTMNAEFHVTTGSYFVEKGLLTEADGDQPGCQAVLHENVIQMGFKPLVYGNVKGFHNPDPTLDDMKFWSKKQGLTLAMVTSSTDGTKMQFEQALVANGLGATILKPAMTGEYCDDADDAGMRLAAKAKELGKPIADYIVSGTSKTRVFIVAEHDKRQREALEYYKFGKGPYYVIPQPNILCHLEIIKTIRRILQGGRPLLNNSANPSISIVALAKKDLKPGHKIKHGCGSFDVRGISVKIEENIGHMPIGLLYDGVVTKPIEKGEYLTFDNTEIPDTLALKAWKTIEEKSKRSTAKIG